MYADATTTAYCDIYSGSTLTNKVITTKTIDIGTTNTFYDFLFVDATLHVSKNGKNLFNSYEVVN